VRVSHESDSRVRLAVSGLLLMLAAPLLQVCTDGADRAPRGFGGLELGRF
jgi:hypothetical protein